MGGEGKGGWEGRGRGGEGWMRGGEEGRGRVDERGGEGWMRGEGRVE